MSICSTEGYKIDTKLVYIKIENPLQIEDAQVSVDLRAVNNTKFYLTIEYNTFCGS